MRIVDTYPAIASSYEGTTFCFEKWKSYIDSVLPNASSLFISDAEQCLKAGKFSWEQDYLPVLNAVMLHDELRAEAHASFRKATDHLARSIYDQFGKDLDVDIVFYLGLCNAAGWVTEYQGKKTIFLGIEKIMELNWCGIDDMYGLIYHELGHVYQAQYGVLHRTFNDHADCFLWQLFTEGIAMYFEQILIGDPHYYHQDKSGWKSWCDDHFNKIKEDFNQDLKTMTRESQRYFGDWVSYHGHSDVGYYLGCRFVRYILSLYEFDEAICFDMDIVSKLYNQFIHLLE